MTPAARRSRAAGGFCNPWPPRAKVVYAIIVTVDEVAELLGASRRAVLREIARLREEGRITRVGSDKTGHGVMK